MFALREIVYAFLLAALLHSIVLCFTALQEVLTSGQALFARAYQLQRCGHFRAAQANLHASIATIRYYYPDLSAQRQAQLTAAMANLTHNYPAAPCDDAMLGVQVEVYRQANDQLLEFWPNYAFRFVHRQ